MKREIAKQSLDVEAKTVATVDNLLAKQISRCEPSVAADGSLFLIGLYVYSYCQDYSGNAAHTSK